jgi:DNA-binding NtrC family response regulator
VRVLAATNRNLAEEVRLQRFRSDLYYRLDVVSLTLPPLRERREDIPELVRRYLVYFARRLCKPVRDIHPAALDAMRRYAWPGNVRELINAMERAVLMTNGTEIQCADLPEPIHLLGRTRVQREAGATEQRAALSALAPEWEGRPWRSVREEVLRTAERHYLIEILTDAEGRIGEAARRAGLDPRSLFEKMRAHELCKEQFRPGTRPPQAGRRLSRAVAGAV